MNKKVNVLHLGTLTDEEAFLAVYAAIQTSFAHPENTARLSTFVDKLFTTSTSVRFGPVLVGGPIHEKFIQKLEQLAPQHKQEACSSLFDFAYTLYGDESACRFNYSESELAKIFAPFSKDEVFTLIGVAVDCAFNFYWEPKQLMHRFRNRLFAADVGMIGDSMECGGEEHLALIAKCSQYDEAAFMTLMSACVSHWNGNHEAMMAFYESLPDEVEETVEI